MAQRYRAKWLRPPRATKGAAHEVPRYVCARRLKLLRLLPRLLRSGRVASTATSYHYFEVSVLRCIPHQGQLLITVPPFSRCGSTIEYNPCSSVIIFPPEAEQACAIWIHGCSLYEGSAFISANQYRSSQKSEKSARFSNLATSLKYEKLPPEIFSFIFCGSASTKRFDIILLILSYRSLSIYNFPNETIVLSLAISIYFPDLEYLVTFSTAPSTFVLVAPRRF